jgi:hypothetical protein
MSPTLSPAPTPDLPLNGLTIVLPCFNEAENLPDDQRDYHADREQTARAVENIADDGLAGI